MSDTLTTIAAEILAAFVGNLIGYFFGKQNERKKWQWEAIKRGLAVHDPMTGRWRWKEPSL